MSKYAVGDRIQGVKEGHLELKYWGVQGSIIKLGYCEARGSSLPLSYNEQLYMVQFDNAKDVKLVNESWLEPV